MRIINKKYLLIILLTGVILTGVIIFKPKETVKLDNVVLKQEVNNKTFAMYTETDSGYEEYKENNFPTAYVLNLDKSKCIDNSGNEIENALYTKDNKVGVRSNKSIYCYLYFDKSLGLEIKEKKPNKLSEDVKGAMYRFQGQAKDENNTEFVNNYICFGTSNKEECVKEPDHHMYRIIGVEAETGRVKVIKMKVLEQKYQWWDDYDYDKTFPESTIYKAITGDDFLENLTYVPEGWKEKISDNTWIYGDMLSNEEGTSQIGEELYQIESGQKATKWYNWANEHTEGAIPYVVQYDASEYKNRKVYYTIENGKWTKTFKGKVSLMYLNDYYYSAGDGVDCEYMKKKYEVCGNSWMNLSQNDNNNVLSEWTMSHFGWNYQAGWFDGFLVNSAGYATNGRLDGALAIRPVFYIDASQKLKSETGTGTIDDPFIIQE